MIFKKTTGNDESRKEELLKELEYINKELIEELAYIEAMLEREEIEEERELLKYALDGINKIYTEETRNIVELLSRDVDECYEKNKKV